MSRRPQLLATSVRGLIAPILRACPQECGIVTITEVDVSADLSYVTVSISALQKPDAALEFLDSKQHELQRKLSGLETHRTPKLRFRIDRSAERTTRLDQLLDQAS